VAVRLVVEADYRRARGRDERPELRFDSIGAGPDETPGDPKMRAIPVDVSPGGGVDPNVRQRWPAEIDNDIAWLGKEEGDANRPARGVEPGEVEIERVPHVANLCGPMHGKAARNAQRHRACRVGACLVEKGSGELENEGQRRGHGERDGTEPSAAGQAKNGER